MAGGKADPELIWKPAKTQAVRAESGRLPPGSDEPRAADLLSASDEVTRSLVMSPARRASTYLGLCAWTVLLVAVTRRFGPIHWKWTRVLSLALGYAGASGIATALAIGPFRVALRRRTPISIDLRRDVGIWAGLTTLAHVYFGLQVHRGGRFREYFFAAAPAPLVPRLDAFGVSNYVGAAAAVLVAAVLFASNDASLRRLGGRRWKALQRLTYAVFALMAAHAWIYQSLERRTASVAVAFTALCLAVCAMQACGYVVRRARRGPSEEKRPGTP